MEEIKINLPEDVKYILNKLHNHGYEAFICGGAVRDSILNRSVHDWDICTSATPSEMLSIFSNERIIETGLQHGTITILLHGIGYEATTFRKDGDYSDNRRPDSVEFVNDLKEDLSRRDFTINAMAYDEEEGLIDPFNGLEDIKNKVIRCVGNPVDRFNEDALRILRAIRFACQLSFSIHPSIGWVIGYTDIRNNLNDISKERINSELCKMIMYPDFKKRILYHYNIFHIIIPNIVYDENTIKHLPVPDLITNLAIFLRYSDADYILKYLKFDNNTKIKVIQLINSLPFVYTGKLSLKKLLNLIGIDQTKRYINVKYNLLCDKFDLNKFQRIRKDLEEIINNNECYLLKDLAIDGNDLKQIGYTGKAIGYVLDALLDDVIYGVIQNDKEILLYIAKWYMIQQRYIKTYLIKRT